MSHIFKSNSTRTEPNRVVVYSVVSGTSKSTTSENALTTPQVCGSTTPAREIVTVNVVSPSSPRDVVAPSGQHGG